jgi:hypothetical protein
MIQPDVKERDKFKSAIDRAEISILASAPFCLTIELNFQKS